MSKSDTVRIVIDIPRAQVQPWLLAQLKAAAEQVCQEHHVTGAQICSVPLASEEQLGDARKSAGLEDLRVTAPAQVHVADYDGAGRATFDGYWLQAWVKIEGGHAPMTSARLLYLARQHDLCPDTYADDRQRYLADLTAVLEGRLGKGACPETAQLLGEMRLFHDSAPTP